MELIFEKKMSLTDKNHRLCVPTGAFNEHFPAIFHGNKVSIRVRYGMNDDEEWKLPCYIRGGANYDKPVISGDWRHIVASKGFQKDDLIKFYKHYDDRCRPFFRFQVFRFVVDENGEGAWVFIP